CRLAADAVDARAPETIAVDRARPTLGGGSDAILPESVHALVELARPRPEQDDRLRLRIVVAGWDRVERRRVRRLRLHGCAIGPVEGENRRLRWPGPPDKEK